ncbi:hypothetical protein ABIE58_003400 [Roseovarius sp. MBR-78]|jgi:hypothetical protein|uniref:hypothetical protein n=1 Tax=Roseovarius sp. MBR-78 TaxID=3156460 RepID=UPI003393D3E3
MTKIAPPQRTRKGAPPSPSETLDNLHRSEAAELKPLNFKVPAEFHREFKAHAAIHGVSMVELLREGFEMVKKKRGC